MKAGAVLRVARPTDHLTAIVEMYATGLDFIVLAQFEDHDGFDGIILGHPQQPYHLEFTTQRGTPGRQSPYARSSVGLLPSRPGRVGSQLYQDAYSGVSTCPLV